MTDTAFHTAAAPRWRIILNPVAGRGQGAQSLGRLEELLARHAPPGVGWWLSETRYRGEAAELARAARAAGFSGVAAAGGDGTLGEVLDGFYSRGLNAGSNGGGESDDRSAPPLPKLAVLPLGTGNDFARCLGIGTDLETAVRAMLCGKPRRIDIGKLTMPQQRERYFINVAGCGFDAVVAARINCGFRRLRGTPAYVAAVLGTLIGYQAVPLRLVADGQVHERSMLLCAVANATSYGGGMHIAPHAQLDDGLFDICIIGKAGRLEFLAAFPRVFRGTHITHRKITMLRARHLRIESPTPLALLADGEIVGTTPAEFEIVPGAIAVMTAP
jgi:diacylglycerol kinase (ATP)